MRPEKQYVGLIELCGNRARVRRQRRGEVEQQSTNVGAQFWCGGVRYTLIPVGAANLSD